MPKQGPYGAIFVGFFGALFGGKPAQASGPTGPMAVVFAITAAVDLITAVAAGVVFASLLFVKEMADLQLANMNVITEVHEELSLTPEEAGVMERNAGKIVLIHVDGPMSFGSAKNMVRRLETAPGLGTFTSCVLDLSDVPVIDGTAALAIDDMLRKSQGQPILKIFRRVMTRSDDLLDLERNLIIQGKSNERMLQWI